MKTKDLISKSYLEQNRQIHASKDWGTDGRKSAKIIRAAVKILGVADILDYGCGRGTLKQALRREGCKLDIYEYDPAIPGKDSPPKRGADLVVCTDVLEHIEPKYIDNVMAHMFELAGRWGYFVIAVKPANQRLPDGRNAHLLVQPPQWWAKLILKTGWAIMGFEEKKDSRGKLKEIRVWIRKP